MRLSKKNIGIARLVRMLIDESGGICANRSFVRLGYFCGGFLVVLVFLVLAVSNLFEVVAADFYGGSPIGFVGGNHEVKRFPLDRRDIWALVLPSGLSGLAERALGAVGVFNDGRRILAGVEVGVPTLDLQMDPDVPTVTQAENQISLLAAFAGTQYAFCWGKRRVKIKDLYRESFISQFVSNDSRWCWTQW